jgi:3-hydroxy acid dehydrogenase/malonic semialdehyde reductase
MIVLVTGATSGFGKAIAQRFAKEGYNVIATGRREDRLHALKHELETAHGVWVKTLCFDVRQQTEVANAIASLSKDEQNIDVLVNNAGLASGLDKIQDGNLDDWENMMDTNVKGLLYVSKAILPFMIARQKGHIINIGSTAGKEVYEKGNVYCASKHAVDAISKGMRIDLLGQNIKVTQVSPGAAETEFSEVRFHGDKEKAKNAYNGYQPMCADDIAEVVYYTTTLPANLCINDLVLTSISQANSFYINRKSN